MCCLSVLCLSGCIAVMEWFELIHREYLEGHKVNLFYTKIFLHAVYSGTLQCLLNKLALWHTKENM